MPPLPADCCRACLAETDVSKLEEQWTQLDRLWMGTRHPVQVGRAGWKRWFDKFRTSGLEMRGAAVRGHLPPRAGTFVKPPDSLGAQSCSLFRTAQRGHSAGGS